MKQPLITVCIASYNHQFYITDCLISVLSQYGNFTLEILIGDDASTDNTADIVLQIIAKHGGNNNIHLYKHEKNLGASQNYQFLIARARGEFIAHLDGDDFWLPGKLQAQLDFLSVHTSSPACYTNAVVLTDDKSHHGFFNLKQQDTISLTTLLKAGNFLNHSSLLYRANAADALLAFPENFIDYRIHLSLAQKGDLGFINKVLVAYRFNSSGSMVLFMRDNVLFMYGEALLYIQHFVSEDLLKRSIHQFLKKNLLFLLLNGKWGVFQKLVNQFRNIYPLTRFEIWAILLPQSFLFELQHVVYRCGWGYELRFLQRNITKKYSSYE